MNGIAVLMYHGIEDENNPSGAKDSGEKIYVLDVKTFNEQMRFLYENGFESLLLSDHKKGSDKSIVITFDDGHVSNFTLALPILQKYGFRAEIFVTSGWIGKENYLNKSQLKELAGAGMRIGSHSITHPFLDDLSEKEIEQELGGSKKALEQIIQASVRGFSAPGGRVSTKVVQIAKKVGYEYVCTSRIGIFRKNLTMFNIPRIALKQTTTFEDFKKVVTQDQVYFLKKEMVNSSLFLAKKILGNRVYVNLRGRLLRDM